MNDLRKHGVAATIWALGWAVAPAAAQPPVVEERVEVLEVGVLADLPGGLRGRTAADLRGRLVIHEGGVAREPVSVVRVGGAGTDAYGSVLVVFDLARCSPEIVSAASAALGAQAARLVALGPVSMALLRDELEPFAGPTRAADEVAQQLARVAREVTCGEAPAAERMETIELSAEALVCPARPCLLAWAGPGWGRGPGADGAAPPPEPEAVEPLARALASRGWAFVAVPVANSDPGPPKRHAPEPNYRPEAGTYTFGINLLGRRDKKPLTEEQVESFVDLWLAPLRRLVAATAGEFVGSADRLADALDALGSRSILYYRTERRVSDPPVRLEVKAPGESGRVFRAPDWAPVAAP